MQIPFPKTERSRFLARLRSGVKEGRARLESGKPVEVQLESRGYGGRFAVIIRPEDQEEFEVHDSRKIDPSRFPRRIKVAALALRLEEIYGRFIIAHYPEDGIVSIQRDD